MERFWRGNATVWRVFIRFLEEIFLKLVQKFSLNRLCHDQQQQQ